MESTPLQHQLSIDRDGRFSFLNEELTFHVSGAGWRVEPRSIENCKEIIRSNSLQ